MALEKGRVRQPAGQLPQLHPGAEDLAAAQVDVTAVAVLLGVADAAGAQGHGPPPHRHDQGASGREPVPGQGQQLPQVLRGAGPGEIAVHPQPVALRRVLQAAAVKGHGHAAVPLPQPGDGLQPLRPAHAGVHQDQVVAPGIKAPQKGLPAGEGLGLAGQVTARQQPQQGAQVLRPVLADPDPKRFHAHPPSRAGFLHYITSFRI